MKTESSDRNTQSSDRATTSVREAMESTKDALSVRRVFGEAYEFDGMKIIPVARLGGGAGGGGGDDDEGGGGSGSGFGIRANPVGVYQVHDNRVDWKPAVDVNRVAKGGQVLAAIIAICVTIVLWSRRR